MIGSIRNEKRAADRVQYLIQSRSWRDLSEGDTRVSGKQRSLPAPRTTIRIGACDKHCGARNGNTAAEARPAIRATTAMRSSCRVGQELTREAQKPAQEAMGFDAVVDPHRAARHGAPANRV